ncbi:MAG: M12 family metallo-peptidase [Woeseiaceae bacterium]|nr:M12 family metallo-peptidase [Woeseiaceae bacterium]
MDWRHLSISIALAGAGIAVQAAPVAGIEVSHHEALSNLRFHAAAGDGGLRAGIAPVSVGFEALGRGFELELEPNAGLLAAMRAGNVGDGVVPYTGRLAGVPGSWAGIVIADGVPAGIVFDGRELYAIEAPGDTLVATDAAVIYRLADVSVAPGALGCAAGGIATSGAGAFTAAVGEFQAAMARAPGAVSEMDVGAVGDFEFTSAKGSNAAAAIVTRLNNVDVIFSEQLGIQLNVPVIETFDTDTDPFTATTDPGALLLQVGSYRSGRVEQRTLGLTHLYTGRDLDGSTVGIAYTGALCDTFYGAGLSEGNGSPTFDSLVAAHEIGHNFGAPHDGTPGSPCEAETGQFLMAATLNNSDEFSACSIQQMQPHIDAANCINPLPSTDISLRYSGGDQTLLLTNAATINFDVINNGTEPAANVVVDVTLPANVELVAGSASSGSCTDGAGAVNCTLGTIGGGSAATVTVSATTVATGSGSFDGIVGADADDDGANNVAAAAITVDPAVELVARAPLPADIVVDTARTVTLRLDNESPLAASDVTLSVTLGAGLAATGADWPGGSCTVEAQQVDCTAAGFPAQSTVSVSLDLNAVSRGSQPVTVTLSAAEVDADPANNSVTGSLRVVAAGGGDDDEGGGGFGLLMLAALGLIAGRRTRRHR